jgi:virginiamycin B lyase
MTFKTSLIASLITASMLALPAPAAAVDLDMRMPGNRFMEFRLPVADGSSSHIASGPDRHLWVTQQTPPQLVRVSVIGETTRLPLPKGSQPQGLTTNREGHLYVALAAHHSIARIHPKTGKLEKEYPLTSPEHSQIGPTQIVPGRDAHTLWFAAPKGNLIGKLDTESGEVTHFPLPQADSQPEHLAVDSAGNVWFTESAGQRVGFLNPDGFIFEFDLPENTRQPGAIVADPREPKAWFALGSGGALASIEAKGTLTLHPLPTPNARVSALAFDPQGLLWLGYGSPDKIAFARIKDTLKITEYPLPAFRARLSGLTLGPEGNLWFVEGGIDKVGYVIGTADYGR